MTAKILIYGPRGPLAQWLEGRLGGVIVEEYGPDFPAASRPSIWSAYSLVIVDSRSETTMGEVAAEIRSSSTDPSPELLYLIPARASAPVRERLTDAYHVRSTLPLPVDLDQLENLVRSISGVSESRPPTTERITGSVSALWDKYRPVNLQRIEKLETAIGALMQGELSDDLKSEAAREAHKLVGAAGTFGFPEASAMAREIEAYLEPGSSPGNTAGMRMSELVEALREVVESGTTDQSVTSGQEVLLIVASRKEEGVELSSAAARRGLLPVVASTFLKAWQVLERSEVRTVLLDLDMTEASVTGLRFLGKLNGRFPSVPVMVLSDRSATHDRVEVSRFGGRGFFPRQRPAADVIDGVLHLLRREDHRPRILAVDDDPQILDAVQSTLESMNVTTLADPGGFLEKVREIDPEMVILDIDMPRINGLELLRAVRMDDAFAHIPAMVLTAHRTTETIREVFAAGADDYLAKPFVAEELVARVSGRIMRSRLSRQLLERDSLTGCLNRLAFSEEYERLASVATESERPVAFVLFRFEGLSQINRRIGHAAGDGALVRMTNRLREVMGGKELIGRWGGTEIVMTLFGLSRDEGAARIEPLIRGLNDVVRIEGIDETLQPWVGASVGGFPEDGRDALALFQKADRSRRSADEAGVRGVVTTGWSASEEGLELVDVVIVDDDETVSSLLVETLKTWKYDVAAISNGLQAIEKLSGPRPAMKARVVLLDVDMPKMDGHAVLRQLRDSGVLKDTRVIMLTVRGSESEVLATMRLGAFDHVTKPFSIPVLLERLRRALEK